MTERAHGFSLNDHRRVSRLVRKDDQGLLTPPTIPATKPAPRGMIRVMLLDDLANWTDPNLPEPLSGDFPLDARHARAAITQPTSVDFGGKPHYMVRCVAKTTDVTTRTWQLNVRSPEGAYTLTAPILERATALQVRDAINATGCPPCVVAGAGLNLLHDDDSQVPWPERQWHIYWPDPTWTLTTKRSYEGGGEEQFDYITAGDEVPIALTPTYFAPTPFAENVFLPFLRPSATPSPGTFALCLPLNGLGLTIIETECWSYVEG